MKTPDRELKYIFTDPVYHQKRMMFMLPQTAKDNNIHSFKDGCKLSIAVKENTDKHRLVEKLCGMGKQNVNPVSSSLLAIKYVASGKFQAAVNTDLSSEYFIKEKQLPRMESFPDPTGEVADVCWIIQKDDVALKNAIDEGLKEIKADGTFDKLTQKWLGKTL